MFLCFQHGAGCCHLLFSPTTDLVAIDWQHLIQVSDYQVNILKAEHGISWYWVKNPLSLTMACSLPYYRHTWHKYWHCSPKFRKNALQIHFLSAKSQRAIIFSITFSVSNLCVTLFPLWPTFHLSHSFNDTLSFICTAAVRPDHLQGTQTHQIQPFACDTLCGFCAMQIKNVNAPTHYWIKCWYLENGDWCSFSLIKSWGFVLAQLECFWL